MDVMNTGKLVLNVAAITFRPSKLTSSLSPYISEEQLSELRRTYAGRYVFFRKDQQVIALATAEDAEPLPSSTPGDIDTQHDFRSVARLVREQLLKYFHEHGRVVTDFDPVTFLAAGKRDDLLAEMVPEWKERPEWIRVVPRYKIHVRTFYPPKRRPYVGAMIDVTTAIEIDKDCATLVELGIDLRGYYVSGAMASSDPRVRPRRRLLGRVRAMDEKKLLLEDAREGSEEVDAPAVHLEPRRETLLALAAHFGASGQTLDKIDMVTRSLHGGRERLARTTTFLAYLQKESFSLVPGVPFSFGPLLGTAGAPLPRVDRAPRPTYVFDPSNRKTDTWNDRGLKKFGPYTSQSLSPTRPRVAVVCQRRYQGRVEQVIYKFLHGVPAGGAEKAPFEQGFIRKYAFQDVNVEFFFASDDSVAAYDKAVRDVLASAGQSGGRWDLVLVQIEESFHELAGNQNPYFVTKATLLSQQIPAQSFEIETIEAADSQLGYVLNNIGLASYAKLGGVPWLLQANPTISHELVFGLGSAELTATRLGARQRTVGITTVFSGDGRYHLSSLSQAVPFDEYPDAVLSSLRSTIDTVRRDFNWRKGDRVRLVFHAFKDVRDLEAKAVKRATADLDEFEVEYAFLHIADHHPFRLFDESQQGVPTRDGMKGILAPERGLFLEVSDRQILLVLTGPQDLKLASQGLPQPVLLKLHQASTFDDMTYLAKQVAVFAAHSWRSFSPASMPVTILYSDLLAGLLPHLTAVDPGVTTALLGRIGSSRWFL